MKALGLPDARFYDNGDEVQLLDYNGAKITEPAALFLPGVLKDSVIKERSSAYKRSFTGTIPDRVAASRLDAPNAIFVSEAALQGAPVWVEQKYYQTLFFSDALKRQIDAAGWAEAFALRPVDVISD